MKKVKLLYFAWVRERIGIEQEELELPTYIDTPANLINWLKTRGPEFENAFTETDNIRVAADQQHINHNEPLGQPTEIALFPPMTGG